MYNISKKSFNFYILSVSFFTGSNFSLLSFPKYLLLYLIPSTYYIFFFIIYIKKNNFFNFLKKKIIIYFFKIIKFIK